MVLLIIYWISIWTSGISIFRVILPKCSPPVLNRLIIMEVVLLLNSIRSVELSILSVSVLEGAYLALYLNWLITICLVGLLPVKTCVHAKERLIPAFQICHLLDILLLVLLLYFENADELLFPFTPLGTTLLPQYLNGPQPESLVLALEIYKLVIPLSQFTKSLLLHHVNIFL